MSEFEFPGFPRTMLFRHLDGSVPPPPGFASWDAYWHLVTRGAGMTTFASPDTVPQGRKVSMVWARAGEDVATIGLHYILLDGGEAIDWDAGAFERVEGNLADIWAAIKGHYTPATTLDRFVWHKWGVDVRRPNPAVRENILSPGTPGTATADEELPAQVAISVTYKTARRKTWGRNYLPAPVKDRIDAGVIVSAFVDDVLAAFGTMVDDQATHDSPLVVWSPRHGGGPLDYGDGTVAGRAAAHAAGTDNPDSSSFAMTVDQVQVDDVPDIIRSRRIDKATHKATHTVGA